MSRALIDVNVLIALIDAEHVHYDAATEWFGAHAANGWATCPIVQNGAIRILASPGYADSPGSAPVVAQVVAGLCARDDHMFWADDVSLVDPAHVDAAVLPGPKHLTDVYLLALARAKGGRLVTFDRKIPVGAVADGARHLEVIG